MSTRSLAAARRPQQWDAARAAQMQRLAAPRLASETPHDKFLRVSRTARANIRRAAERIR